MRKISHQPRAGSGVEHHRGGSRIPAHVHDDDQLVYVSQGVLAIETSRGRWAATPERAVVIPAGVWHEHRVHGRCVIHIVGLHGEPASASSSPRVVPVSPLVRELVLSISGGNLDSGARSTAMSLLVKLTLVTSSAELRLPSAVDARLARACSLVEDELTRRISIGDLAGSVGTSERTLSRLFRAEFGMTYPQWRSVLRVFHASVALAEGDSITGAAMRTGFSTPAAFATQFSRLTGHAPNQLLQRARP